MSQPDFRAGRRQPYLSEESFRNTIRYYSDGSARYKADLKIPEIPAENRRTMFHVISDAQWSNFQLMHTAGESPANLAGLLTTVVEEFEQYADACLEVPDDEYDPAFSFDEMIDVYVKYLHLLCVAILLRREDLIPRIYGLIENTDYDGEDGVVEKLLGFYLPARPVVAEVCWERPLGQLLDAVDRRTSVERANEMQKYVKNWYRSMKGQAAFWGKHEKIEPTFTPYMGYWAMCAGAFTYLLDIDDSSYRDELVFPKDLLDYARSLPSITQEPSASARGGLRVEGGRPCPLAGFWSTPAQQNSRRLFEAGEVMPTFEHSAYGATIWQWSEEQ